MKSTSFAITAAIGLSLGAMLGAVPASAKDAEVSYADLNLDTDAGRAQLEQRIERAARKVCDYDVMPTGTLIRPADAQTCYLAAKSHASRQVAAILERNNLGG